MKAVLLVILVIVIIFLCYNYFVEKPPESADTPLKAAKAFVHAAVANDMEAVRRLCVESIKDTAVEVAGQIVSASPDPAGARYQNMRAKYPREGTMILIAGRVIAMEMIKQDDEWKIVSIQITQQ